MISERASKLHFSSTVVDTHSDSLGRIAQVEALPDEFGQAEVPRQGGRKEQPGIGHQAAVVEGDLDPVGVVAWQHLLGAPFPGPFFCYKTIIPEAQEHLLAASGR